MSESEMIDELLADARERMAKSVEAMRHEFGSVRTGRASPALLDRISVDYYGTATPLKQLATVTAPEARLDDVGARLMSGDDRQATLLRPAAVAVGDDGDVSSLSTRAAGLRRLGRLLLSGNHGRPQDTRPRGCPLPCA